MHLIKLTLLLLCFFFIGCQDEKKESYLDKIQKMNRTLDSLETVAQEKRIDTIPTIIHNVRTNISEVKEYYIADTIDMELANRMNNYKDIRKVLASNSGNIAKVNTTIPEVREKLNHLEHDIQKGLGDREKYQEYIHFEQNKISEIESVLNYYLETNEKYIHKYDSLNPMILDFIQRLKKGNEK